VNVKMGWKTINGHRYYYKSRRVGGRIETTYHGAGESASLFAQIDAIDRLEKVAEREKDRDEREESDSEEQTIAGWFDHVQTVADAAMVEAGFHKHRGQWRRKRG
jgi:hypothetical protein